MLSSAVEILEISTPVVTSSTSGSVRFAREQEVYGTNDLLENPDFTAVDVAKRMERFLKRMMEEAGLASRKMRLRLIAPPAMQEGQWVDRPELLTESRNLGKEYKRIAKRLGIAFTDASGWEIPTIYDGVHFTKEGHRIFAENIRKELNI